MFGQFNKTIRFCYRKIIVNTWKHCLLFEPTLRLTFELKLPLHFAQIESNISLINSITVWTWQSIRSLSNHNKKPNTTNSNKIEHRLKKKSTNGKDLQTASNLHRTFDPRGAGPPRHVHHQRLLLGLSLFRRAKKKYESVRRTLAINFRHALTIAFVFLLFAANL